MTNPIQTQDVKSVWKVDPSHTLVEFSAKHMMFTTVKGRFNKIETEVDWDETDVTKSSVVAKIDAASLTTGDEKRDGHLRSADFLDVENHPTLTFKSIRVEAVGDNEYRVYGDLTIRDITKPVTLQTSLEGYGKSPWGTTVAAFEAHTEINRKEWNLNWNVALETGGVLVSDKIKIEIHVELIKQQ